MTSIVANPHDLCVTPSEHTRLMAILTNVDASQEETKAKLIELLGEDAYEKIQWLKQHQGTTAIRVVSEVRQRFAGRFS